MKSAIINFFKPPIYSDFEKTQKAKVLHVTLLVSVLGSLLLGGQNIAGETNLDQVLFAASAVFLIGVWGNKKGYFTVVASLLSLLILALITFALIVGVGLWDAGMIAYPFFILFTSFLFNRKAAPIATVLAALSVGIIFYLESHYLIDLASFHLQAQFANMVILIAAVGIVIWTVMGNWENSLENLREAYSRTLVGWAKALEYRDRETEGHSQRVTNLCIELAKRFGFSSNDLANIRRGALLHDIGKLAIPDTILLKNGSLTEDEWEMVKKHPGYARDLMEDIPFLIPAMNIPYYHHERWDGSGYPEGLSREEIPLPARLFAVVDVWDALLSDRPYRQAWSEARTIEYLQEQAGSLFDPKIVDVFLALIKEQDVGSGEAA